MCYSFDHPQISARNGELHVGAYKGQDQTQGRTQISKKRASFATGVILESSNFIDVSVCNFQHAAESFKQAFPVFVCPLLSPILRRSCKWHQRALATSYYRWKHSFSCNRCGLCGINFNRELFVRLQRFWTRIYSSLDGCSFQCVILHRDRIRSFNRFLARLRCH